MQRDLALRLNEMGWTTETMYVSPEGQESFSDSRPIFEGLQEAGLIESDDAEMNRRNGNSYRSRARRGPKRRTQLSDYSTDHVHYGILGQIETAAGSISLPLGWKGGTGGLLSFMAMDMEELELITQLPRDYLEQVEWIVT